MRHDDHSDDRPTLTEMLGEVIDLSAGLGILLLPLLVTALPGVILFLLLPAVLLIGAVAAPVAIAAMLFAPPYLLVRATRRRLRRPR
jgi:Flp pilus assembly protein TadB